MDTWRDERLAVLSKEDHARFDELTAKFRARGADDPEGWALSEVTEDIAQLARFCVLRRLWSTMLDPYRDQANAWIERAIGDAGRDPKGYFADAGLALKRLLANGADVRILGGLLGWSPTRPCSRF